MLNPVDRDRQSVADWLGLRFHDQRRTSIVRPHEYEKLLEPPVKAIDENVLERVAGSLLGLAIGDALGAHVEFRPRDYLLSNPVTDLSSGGTWGLEKGQFTDDTSMALSLAISLIVCEKFNLYDQLVRYKWWFRHGYMSSTGQCFDIGNATRQSIERFEQRQCVFVKTNHISSEEMDFHTDNPRLRSFDVYCSQTGVAGNGALMRLAPVPLFFFRDPPTAVEYAGLSGIITHGDIKAYDACRYYAALIVAALRGDDKASLLNEKFYEKYRAWFGNRDLHPDILAIARGSYKRRGGYDEGIRGSGYIVKALQAALWAFWSAETFKDGALAAVNLGDDTDTTAAIYGQLAGAYYRLNNLPGEWLQHVYAKEFILTLAKWISTEGEQFLPKMVDYPIEPPVEHHDKLSSEDQFHIHIQRTSSCEDVCEWLQTFRICTAKDIDAFKLHDVDGYRLLHFVDKTELKDLLTVQNKDNHRAVYNAIRRIRRQSFLHKHMPNDNFYQRFAHDEYSEAFSEQITKNKNVKSSLKERIRQYIGELPPNTSVDRIEILPHHARYTRFLQQIESAQYKQTQSEFQLQLQQELNLDERISVHKRLVDLAKTVQHEQEPYLARLWYGCSRSKLKEPMAGREIILKKKANGWFGNGIYLSSTAKDASVSTGSNECLILCYAILLNPFPIITDDARPNTPPEKFRFYNCEKHANYRCHYVPVGLAHSESPLDIRPPPEGVAKAIFDQVVIFDQNDILPVAVVHLKSTSQSSPMPPHMTSTESLV